MMKTKNAQLIAIKQALAFMIDLSLVSLPLIIAPSLEIFPLFVLLWCLYIPLMEYFKTQTLGMMISGTRIVNSNDMQSHITLGNAFRRQIARVSMMWGVVGWLFLFFGKQYMADYAIVDKNYSSIQIGKDGWIAVHNQNQYKIIFFVLFLMLLFSFIKEML